MRGCVDGLQTADQPARVDRLCAELVDVIDGRLEQVDALKHDIDDLTRHLLLAGPNDLKDVFHLMGERRHRVEPHG